MNKTDLKIKIGSRIKNARVAKKLTQSELSEMINVSQKHLSEVERGISSLSVKNLIDLSEILETSLDYLLKGSNSFPSNKNERILLEIYHSSSSYTQSRLINIIQLIIEMIEHD